MSINEKCFRIGSKIYTNPDIAYDYCGIISGVTVKGNYSNNKVYKAVSKNTWRAFHRVCKTKPGASVGFQQVLIKCKSKVINDLKKSCCVADVDTLSDFLCDEIRSALKDNFSVQKIQCYNKIRKPIDLYLSHIVAMANDFKKDERQKLVPFLRLPIDSWIAKSDDIFSNEDRKTLGLKKNAGFGNMCCCGESYLKVQCFLRQKAAAVSSELKCDFHPIYFDVLWGNRREKTCAKNLFDAS
jgi:hypothetical protein